MIHVTIPFKLAYKTSYYKGRSSDLGCNTSAQHADVSPENLNKFLVVRNYWVVAKSEESFKHVQSDPNLQRQNHRHCSLAQRNMTTENSCVHTSVVSEILRTEYCNASLSLSRLCKVLFGATWQQKQAEVDGATRGPHWICLMLRCLCFR
jgi:hypothetical protein